MACLAGREIARTPPLKNKKATDQRRFTVTGRIRCGNLESRSIVSANALNLADENAL